MLTVTPGNVTDYDYITNDIVEISKTLVINKIFYDPYNATQ
jgi:phage terminase large subunit-like protein